MTIVFETAFERLTGNAPFPWQRALFDRFVIGSIPETCAIPTGLGKTSVIAVWLIAREVGAALPRRLVYVVNRRTVVDQTTVEVARLRANAKTAGLRESFALSTLRGQTADNREWAEDPSRPAVISGTVDMIGSRLLFSGYRIGFKTKPLHAGFLGQDSLIVHDESHLEPAFQVLLEAIRSEQGQARRGDPWPMQLMALSATARRQGDALVLSDMDRAHPIAARRLGAPKRLVLHACADKELLPSISARIGAFADSGRAILVFVRTVDGVNKVKAALPRSLQEQTRVLTGTMRGYERDLLVESDRVFARFLPDRRDGHSGAEGTVVLVCTSAGEVGVNLSGDHLVSDLSTFDSMAQRFGRVNRFGDVADAEVHVFHPEDHLLDAAVASGKVHDAASLRATLALLRDTHGDVSPSGLERLPPEQRVAAFAPAPETLPTSSILFDAWSMTTVRSELPGRPPVTEYLHGVASWEPPTTQVAWRMEVDLVVGDLLAEYPPAELLEDYPLKPHELLLDRSSRVAEVLLEVAADSALRDVPIWIIRPDGRVDVTRLGVLIARARDRLEDVIANCTLLLAPSRSRPDGGTFTKSSWDTATIARELGDVADAWSGESGQPRRRREFDAVAGSRPPEMRLIRTISLVRDEDQHEDDDVASSVEGARPRTWRWYERPHGADGDGPRDAPHPVALSVHSADVRARADSIVNGLGLPRALARTVVMAAWLHDIGKQRRAWQLGIGNRSEALVLAKGGGRLEPRDLTPYRHELGSVLDAMRQGLLSELEPDDRELALHLIAAHHGRARPHFPPDELFDPELAMDFDEQGLAVMMRFARLQRRFGRWGLAYLESLVRAADYQASAAPSAFAEVGP